MEVQPVQVISTYPSREEAVKLGNEAVRLHMAACAQITSELTSIYHWEGKIRSGREYQLVLKTIGKREAELVSWLRANHPYKVAEIIIVPLSYVTPEYLAWMKEVTYK